MRVFDYNRQNAVEYAKKWALKRNPKYYNFDNIGGNCTSFASQCLFAGAPIMNYTKDLGWYYNSVRDRAPAWSGVAFFCNFLLANNLTNGGVGNGVGPFGKLASKMELEIGDFIQFGNSNAEFYHTAIITAFRANEPLLSAHSSNSYNRPLSSYSYEQLRLIKIEGYKNF